MADNAPHLHADPFAGLELAAGTARAVVVPAHAELLCDGHFPGDPLLPGAYLAELMAGLAARLVPRAGGALPLPAEVVRCVFLAPVRPDESIEVRARVRDGAALVDAGVWVDGTHRARAIFRFVAP